MNSLLRQTVAGLLIVMLVFAFMPFSDAGRAYADDSIANGKTGDCTFEILRDSSRSIYYMKIKGNGNGRMADYSYDDRPPYYQYRSIVEEIEFEGVAEIGDYAFMDFVMLRSTYIGDVKRIGNHAFYGCSKLEGVTVDGHSQGCVIEDSAFAEAMDFEDRPNPGQIDLTNVVSIGVDAFNECDAEVTLRPGLKSIGDYAFAHNYIIEEVTIPKGCTKLGDWAFYDDRFLSEVTIVDTVCAPKANTFETDYVTFFVKKGSAAHDFVKQNGCDYYITGNSGSLTVNLIKGETSYDSYGPEGKNMAILKGLEMMEDNGLIKRKNSGPNTFDLDVNKDGKYDISLYLHPDSDKMIFKKLSSNSVKTRQTVKLPDPIISDYANKQAFYSSLTFVMDKSANTLTAKGKTATIKYSKLRKKTQYIIKTKAYAISKPQGTVTYTKVSVSSKKYAKKFLVNKTTGKITVKKGVRKGTYKLKVKITAAGTAYYKAGSKTVTVIIRVK